jgi:hypothetical protein
MGTRTVVRHHSADTIWTTLDHYRPYSLRRDIFRSRIRTGQRQRPPAPRLFKSLACVAAAASNLLTALARFLSRRVRDLHVSS